MARKRMFDTEIITQDSFLDLPMESKALYFLLGMEADDEGFINPNKVLRLYGGTQDAIKVLIAKEYIIPFKSGVVVITDWNTNNWLDKRRAKNTIYLKEKNLIKVDKNTNKYVVAKPMLSECLESIEESSIEEYRVEESSSSNYDDNIFDFIQKMWGVTLNPAEYEVINEWEDDELTRYAIKQSALNKAYNTKYVMKILKSYKDKGITTAQEAEQSENNRLNAKSEEIPIVLQEHVSKELTTKEKEEMKGLLSDFK